MIIVHVTEICQGAFSFPFHEEGFCPQVIHKVSHDIVYKSGEWTVWKVKTSLFINTIEFDQCLNEELPSMTVFVIACLARGIIDGHHNCFNTVLTGHSIGTVSFFRD